MRTETQLTHLLVDAEREVWVSYAPANATPETGWTRVVTQVGELDWVIRPGRRADIFLCAWLRRSTRNQHWTSGGRVCLSNERRKGTQNREEARWLHFGRGGERRGLWAT